MAEHLEAPTTSPSIFPDPDRPHPMASALLVWEAANILAHPGRFHWKRADDGSLVCDNAAIGGKGRVIFWINGGPEQQFLLSLGGAAASAALTAFDSRAAAMHLLYASYATTLKRPWEEKFTITGQQMARNLGLDLTKRGDMNQQNKLDLILRLARLPAQLLVHVDWPARGKQEAFTIEQSRLWDIEVTYNGQKTPHGRERLKELEIHVRPGPWAKYFLNQQGRQEDKARYEYGYLTQNCLKAMMSCWQKNPGAVRLMIWLLFQSRVEMKDQYNVSTLLEVAYGGDILEQAKHDRRRRSQLAKRWDNELRILRDNGWSITFDTHTYPPCLQPDWADRSSNQLERRDNHFDQLLHAKCGLLPPAKIESALHRIASKKTKQRAPQGKYPLPTREEIRASRHAQGLKQADLARAMGQPQSWVSMIESGQRQVSSKDAERLWQVLGLK